MPSIASPMARWSISSCFTSRSEGTGGSGTCSTLPIRRLLPVWPPYCMIRWWGYPPQKRPDPGRIGPSGLPIAAAAKPYRIGARRGNVEREQNNAQDQNRWFVAAEFEGRANARAQDRG